jgi:hypothetical protein
MKGIVVFELINVGNRIDKRHVLDNIWIIISMILFFLNWVLNNFIKLSISLKDNLLTPIRSVYNQLITFLQYFLSLRWLNFCMKILANFLLTVINNDMNNLNKYLTLGRKRERFSCLQWIMIYLHSR